MQKIAQHLLLRSITDRLQSPCSRRAQQKGRRQQAAIPADMPHAAVQSFRLLCDAIRHCFSGVQGLRNRLLRGTGLCRELRQKRRRLRRCPDFIRRIDPHPASSFRSDVFSLREPGPERPRHSCREAPLPSGAKPGCQTGRRTSAADRCFAIQVADPKMQSVAANTPASAPSSRAAGV